MDKNSSSLFREKSINSIDEPCDLNKQIKITTPHVLTILLAVLVFVVGFFVWANLHDIETTKKALVLKEDDGNYYCYMKMDYSDYCKAARYKTIIIKKKEYHLNMNDKSIFYNFFTLKNDENDALTRAVLQEEYYLDDGDKYYYCAVDNCDEVGTHTIGNVVIDREHPIDYLFEYEWE